MASPGTDSVTNPYIVVGTIVLSIILVFATAMTSIFIVMGLKSALLFIVRIISVIGEIGIACVAAITSGATIGLTVVIAAGASAMTFPCSYIEARICVAIGISAASIMASAAALMTFTSLEIDMEVVGAVIGAAAMSVAFAAAWAVGVMSLIEKETRQVGFKMTSVIDAVRHNNYRILKLLLRFHAGVRQRDINLALVHSVKSGYIECIEALLSAGADVNTRDPYDNSPLLLACETGSCHIGEMLIDAGAEVDRRNGERGCAIHHAAKWGYKDCVELLLSNGADPDVQDGLWRTPLILAAKHARHAENLMHTLISAGCDVNIIGNESQSALHHAAIRGVGVELLIDKGAVIDLRDSQGHTPLHYAAQEGHMKCVTDLLLGGKSNPNISNYQRRTPLHFAAGRGHYECLEELVNHKGDPYVTDTGGNLPLWYAASHGHLKCVIYFLTLNTPLGPYYLDNFHVDVSNPLLPALQKKYLLVARMLLIGGCNSKPLVDWLMDIPAHITWSDENLEHLDWLKEFPQNPMSLSHACRCEIRRVLGIKMLTTVNELPLPTKLKYFICMTELWDFVPENRSLQPFHTEVLPYFRHKTFEN